MHARGMPCNARMARPALPPLHLTARLHMAAAGETPGPRRFEGLAYGGDRIADRNAVINLAGLTLAQGLPLLARHNDDPAAVVGRITQAAVTPDGLSVTGELFSHIDPLARSIGDKADAGVAWQMSVGLYDITYREIPARAAVTLNGRSFDGPLTVFDTAFLREISIVALGADSTTHMQFFSVLDQATPPPPAVVTEPSMSDTPPDLSARVAELEAQLTAATGRASAAESALEDLRKSTRLSELSALFAAIGRPLPANDAQTHYLTMSAEAFAAVAADLRALRPAPSRAALLAPLPPYSPASQASGLELAVRKLAGIKE